MFESDADRLAMIKSLGGQLVRAPKGEFWAIFDNGYQDSSMGDVDIESTQPTLTARTIDIEAIFKDTALQIGNDAYRFVKHEPDGTGMSRVMLRL